MRPSETHLYKRVCPSICLLVHLSISPLGLCKNRVCRLIFAKMRSYTASNEQSCFESLRYYCCRFICLSVHLSLHICHMINTHRDTTRTHRCPFGLVLCRSVTPVQKPRFSAVFGHGEILYKNRLSVLRAFFATLLIHLSVRPSVPPCMSLF